MNFLQTSNPPRRDDLMQVCHHEAGHAVADWRFGTAIDQVEIVSHLIDGQTCHSGFVRRAPITPMLPRTSQALRGQAYLGALALLAGPAAGRRIPGLPDHELRCGSDFVQAEQKILMLTSSPQSYAAMWRHLEAETELFVTDHWPHITALAEVLATQRRMSGAEVAALLMEIEASQLAAIRSAHAGNGRASPPEIESDLYIQTALNRRHLNPSVREAIKRFESVSKEEAT